MGSIKNQIQTNISSGQWRNADSYAGCVQAKFCSSACLGWSWQQGHRHESGLLHLVDSKEIGRMATLAYRYMDMVEYSRDKGVRPREECADRAMLDASLRIKLVLARKFLHFSTDNLPHT